MKERLIFHVDVNSAYLSWEAVHQLKNGASTDIRTIPSIIGGDTSLRKGVVLAKSLPAKRFRIHTGEPVTDALTKCPTLQSFQPNFPLYHKYSKAFITILKKYAPVVEQVSIDEAYLDMSGLHYFYSTPLEAAEKIQTDIRETLDFTVNIGISSNKLLAKMASDFEKPDKVHTLFPDEIETKMWPLPIRNLLFLGKASEKKLNEIGIHTIGDLARANETDIQALLGSKNGHQLHQYALGIDDSPVKEQADAAKGFSAETTFNEDITSLEQVFPILLEQCDIVATRMRRQQKKCLSVAVTFRTLDFKKKSHQATFQSATDVTDEIYKQAKKLFREFWKGEPLRLIGVALTNLSDDEYEQLSLFENTENKERHRKLDAALDTIRQKYGNDKITRASIMNSNSGIARKARAQMQNELETRRGKQAKKGTDNGNI